MAMNKDFGAFELKQKIGAGGMASVYLAVQKALQRQVVLKILYPHLAEDEKLVLRFEREARAAARLRHENIIQVIDMGRHEDVAYIAMEFVEGMDLKKWLDAHGTPPIEMAVLLVRDLCRGLEHAHANHIIHRDIKPANIMLTPDGTVKLMDFGLARSGSETSTQMTMVGSVMGTPAYMSPEQAAGEVVDERSDIFSTGVLAYELLGGRRPFLGDSYSTVLRSILTVEPPDVTEFNPLVPDEIARVVRGTLQKDVSKRFQKLEALREGFEEAIEQMGLHRGKDLLREYVADPDAMASKWRQKRLSRHLDQGLYYENMGLGKIDDALLEFRRVLYLQPDNAIAREHARKLEREREKLIAEKAPTLAPDAETVILTPEQLAAQAQAPRAAAAPAPPVPAKPAAPPPKPAKPSKPVAEKPAPPAKPAKVEAGASAAGPKRLVPVLIGSGVLLVAILAFGAVKMMGGKPTPAAPEVTVPATSYPAPAADSTAVIAATPTISAPDTIQRPPFEAGRAAFESSHWASAARSLRRAVAQRGAPAAERRAARELLAQALVRDGRGREAARVFSDLLRADPTYIPVANLSPEERKAYEAARLANSSAPRETTRVAPPPPPPPAPASSSALAAVTVRITPFAASLAVDGKIDDENRNKGVFILALKPGKHTLVVKHPTLGSHEWSVEVEAGEKKTLTHDFAQATGSVSVSSDPSWGDLYVDGVRIGHTTPWEIQSLTPGKHEISLVREGWTVDGGAKTVDVRAGETRSIKFKLKKRK